MKGNFGVLERGGRKYAYLSERIKCCVENKLLVKLFKEKESIFKSF